MGTKFGMLLHYFVGASENRGGDSEVKCFGRRQAYHEIELGWLLDRNIRRFRTTQNLVHQVR